MTNSQLRYDVRCEWGVQGVATLAPASDVVIIVDIFSFSTSVEIATARGAAVYPFDWRDDSAAAFARAVGGELAGRNVRGLSLKPSTLEQIDAGCRLVLPSPNGSTLSTLTGETPTIAGCFRNSEAVGGAAMRCGSRIAVIAAGEQWPDGTLRPCFEDLCGAGAVIRHLNGTLSPESNAARAVYDAALPSLKDSLWKCESGQEKESKDVIRDIELAAALDVSDCVPLLRDGAYRRM